MLNHFYLKNSLQSNQKKKLKRCSRKINPRLRLGEHGIRTTLYRRSLSNKPVAVCSTEPKEPKKRMSQTIKYHYNKEENFPQKEK